MVLTRFTGAEVKRRTSRMSPELGPLCTVPILKYVIVCRSCGRPFCVMGTNCRLFLPVEQQFELCGRPLHADDCFELSSWERWGNAVIHGQSSPLLVGFPRVEHMAESRL